MSFHTFRYGSMIKHRPYALHMCASRCLLLLRYWTLFDPVYYQPIGSNDMSHTINVSHCQRAPAVAIVLPYLLDCCTMEMPQYCQSRWFQLMLMYACLSDSHIPCGHCYHIHTVILYQWGNQSSTTHIHIWLESQKHVPTWLTWQHRANRPLVMLHAAWQPMAKLPGPWE